MVKQAENRNRSNHPWIQFCILIILVDLHIYNIILFDKPLYISYDKKQCISVLNPTFIYLFINLPQGKEQSNWTYHFIQALPVREPDHDSTICTIMVRFTNKAKS